MSEPWDKWKDPERIPNPNALRNWRRRADRLAEQRGAKGGCHLCKRAVDYRRGTLELWSCRTWRQRPLRFRLCESCERILRQFLDKLQVELKKDRLPIDE